MKPSDPYDAPRDGLDGMSLDAIRAAATHVYRTGGGSRPDVLGVDLQGRQLVLKDFNGCDGWFAFALGRLFAAREARTMRRLAGIRGVPLLVGRPGPRAIVMERVAAEPVLKTRRAIDWPAFFSSFETLVHAMHERGVAHCDLRSPHNILVDEHDDAWVVDFVGATHRASSWNPLSGWLFTQLAGVDRSAIVKLKARVAEDLITPEERTAIEQGHPLERPARGIGQGVRRLTRRLLTGSRN